jgi:hypothetical protein
MRQNPFPQIILFLVFLFGGSVLVILHRGSATVSETENRQLAAPPGWPKNAFGSRDYFVRVENYLADHIAFREPLASLGMSLSSLRGVPGGNDKSFLIASHADNTAETQPETGNHQTSEAASESHQAVQAANMEKGGVLGKVLIIGDRAMKLFSYSHEAGKAYADTINRFPDELGSVHRGNVRLFSLLVPTSVEFVHNTAFRKMSDSQQDAIHAVYRRLDSRIIPVDAVTELHAHEGPGLYFRTDHHWTATGAYYAYQAFMKSQGSPPIPLETYERQEVAGFLGSLYYSTLNRKLRAHPDRIVLYKPYLKHEYDVYYKGPLKMKLLDLNHASKKNKYRIFLSGDRPLGRISTEEARDRRIAVVKDSYGNALIPFLLPHYREIYVIDPRQFHQALTTFVEQHRIEDVLFLCNAEAISHTGFTGLLRGLLRNG